MTGNKNHNQIYSAYDGFMVVWDCKLSEDTNFSAPSLHLPNRVRPVFKVAIKIDLEKKISSVESS